MSFQAGPTRTLPEKPSFTQLRKQAKELLKSYRARTDLAEQKLWATGDVEIVRLCLAHMTRPPNDSWWNYVLIAASEPEKLKLILDHGIDPGVRGPEGYTILHHLASGYCRGDNRLILAMLPATGCWRVPDRPRLTAQIDAAWLGLPLGTDGACAAVLGTRGRRRRIRGRALGQAYGAGEEGEPSGDHGTVTLLRRRAEVNIVTAL